MYLCPLRTMLTAPYSESLDEAAKCKQLHHVRHAQLTMQGSLVFRPYQVPKESKCGMGGILNILEICPKRWRSWCSRNRGFSCQGSDLASSQDERSQECIEGGRRRHCMSCVDHGYRNRSSAPSFLSMSCKMHIDIAEPMTGPSSGHLQQPLVTDEARERSCMEGPRMHVGEFRCC